MKFSNCPEKSDINSRFCPCKHKGMYGSAINSYFWYYWTIKLLILVDSFETDFCTYFHFYCSYQLNYNGFVLPTLSYLTQFRLPSNLLPIWPNKLKWYLLGNGMHLSYSSRKFKATRHRLGFCNISDVVWEVTSKKIFWCGIARCNNREFVCQMEKVLSKKLDR